MEKFTEWRDPGTGILPFMPIGRRRRTPLLERLVQLVLTVFYFVSKAVPLALLVLLTAIPVALVRQFVLKAILSCVFSTNYLSFGTDLVDLGIEGVKKSNYKLVKANSPQKGDFVVVNFTSPLDPVLWYILCSDAVYVTFSEDGKSLVELSFAETIAHSLSSEPLDSGKQVKLLSLKGKCVFFIAEGTTSNGKAILPYNYSEQTKALLSQNRALFKFKVMSTRLVPGDLTTPVPELKFGYLMRLLRHTSTLQFKTRLLLVDPDQLQWELLRQKSADLGRVRAVGRELDIQSKRRFLKKYMQ